MKNLFITCNKFKSHKFILMKTDNDMKNISNVLSRKQCDIFFRLVENCSMYFNFKQNQVIQYLTNKQLILDGE